ncbi:sugar phosphate isomerase/epimerase family protein [Spongiactinospora sp. TRM90649]|uniref:sugar phosphate isomerase/epimerase family protein n=1 Tax=Spongiactinospora sp. TRM90649 TaxID=3031114 RepID=UPI0023F9D03C|nr:sugar phosphate isomerase/epimerase family protein [Spongiactinospora sp. TRM90649]MDF5752486.1 sugar phosphate isomerase/epimerase [Spongiactinospora sp. TRM90649]
MSMRITCQEQLIPGRTLQEKHAFAVRAGFDGIELRGKGGRHFESRLPELERAKADGVVMPTVCVEMDHFIGDFSAERRRDAIDNLASQLTVIAELGGLGVLTPASWAQFSRRLPPFEPPRSPADDRAVLLDALTELGEHAAELGVLIMLEPLNRYEDHMVNSIGQAVDLCRATGLGSVRVAADTYHMNIEEDDPCSSLAEAAPYLAHVQVSESNRNQPGTGHLDWPALLATLDAIGHQGDLALSGGLRGEPETVLPQTAAFLRKFL